MPVYAECGGLMFLARSLQETGGRSHPMVGMIPAKIRMSDRLQNFGYQQVKARQRNWMMRPGETARGHEFHHSRLQAVPAEATAAYEVTKAGNGAKRLEGYARKSLIASYIHLHFWSCPRWAGRFVQAARDWRHNASTDVGKVRISKGE